MQKREFEEETGFELLKPKELFAASLQPSRSNQIIHLVIGLVGKQNVPKRDVYEEMSVKFFTKR
ncbi:MAG: NUDIX hydrolase [Nitrososphaerales archaeon]